MRIVRSSLPRALLAALLSSLLCAPVSSNDTVPVTVAPIEKLSVAQSFRAPAEVISLNESRISTEIDGVVKSVAADEGDMVEEGATLVTLDTTDLELASQRIQADVAAIEARIERAKLDLGRVRDLSEKRFVSAEELLARETDLSVLTAELRRQELQLQSARRDIDKANVTAPYHGVVTERFAQLGGYLRRGDPVAVLVDTERFEVEARIPGRYASHFTAGVDAWFEAVDESWPVRLDRLFPITEDGERINRARFRFNTGSPRIGTAGVLRWQSQHQLLPADLLVRRAGKLGVFIAEDTTARFVEVRLAQEGRPSPHDLPAGTQVVVNGRDRLRDGATIRISE